MNESVYRRLCLTSVCGAILIPLTMALVSTASDDAAPNASGRAIVASATTVGTAVAARKAGAQPTPQGGAKAPSRDRTTHR
jgi:hypothetical protein